MKTITFTQGSPEWIAHRAQHFNASDAPAMLDCSPHMTRNELLTRLKTGISPDVDPATQRRFDDGHRFEALARPLAEAIIGEELYPVTGTNGKLSASFDGLTLLECTAWEHKTLNESLSYTPWDEGNGYHLPLHYQVQMEHQLLVSGAKCVLFMASRWDGETLLGERHCWYASDPALRQRIVTGWAQFDMDLAEFVPTAPEVKPIGRAPESLPALRIEVTGAVTASNLAEFKAQAMAVFQGISRDLQTDADFANAEATVKWAKGIEDRLASAKESALAQTESIDALFRTIDDISAEARRVRLDLDKLVKARKDAIKAEIVDAGRAALDKHLYELESAMPGKYMPDTVPANFGGCIKGLKSLDSIRNAVDSELARAKIAAGEIATRVHANLKTLQASGLVVHDTAALVLKAPDDLSAVIAQRLAAEQARQDAERERIRAEEAARLEREAKADAERIERQRAHAAQVEADRIAREQAEAVSAARIREEQAAEPAQFVSDQAARASQVCTAILAIQTPVLIDKAEADRNAVAFIDRIETQHAEDTGARLTLGQINERLAPVSISVAGLQQLGFAPVEQVKASRFYRECDLPAIAQAIARHVVAAAAEQLQAA